MNRRGFVRAVTALTATALIPPQAARAAAPHGRRPERLLDIQTSWDPVPVQSPAREGVAELPGGARLWFWDTGGAGIPVVLLHPATGSGAIWVYQQPVLARVGYRVIGYSRRGHFRSGPGNAERPGSGAGDLHELMDYLHVGRFHLVGSAAGGFVVPDYALSHPDRLLTITIASSLGGVIDPAFRRTSQALLPEGFREMPASFREIGPSYRAANPAGVEEWDRLERQSKHGERIAQPPLNQLEWKEIERIKTPALLISGDADLFMPPSRVREYASHLGNAEIAIIPEAGHSAYWEQPQAFNTALLRFMAGPNSRFDGRG